MGNSAYNKMCDFACYHHLAAMGMGQISGANGGVYMRFKRSLRLLEAYELRTRVLSWNKKWLFLEHRFMTEGRIRAAGMYCGLRLASGQPKWFWEGQLTRFG